MDAKDDSTASRLNDSGQDRQAGKTRHAAQDQPETRQMAACGTCMVEVEVVKHEENGTRIWSCAICGGIFDSRVIDEDAAGRAGIIEPPEKGPSTSELIRRAKAQKTGPDAKGLAVDCGKSDCQWYDEGKGYEECKFCTRFSKCVSGSLRADRYVPKKTG